MKINALEIVKYPVTISYKSSWINFWGREKIEMTHKLGYF